MGMVVAPQRFAAAGGGPFTSSGQFGMPDNAKTRDYVSAANELDMRKITSWAGAAPTFQSVEIKMGATVVNGSKLKAAIYADNGGSPSAPTGAPVAVSNEITIATADANTVKTLAFGTPYVGAANTSYWVAVLTDSANHYCSWFSGNGQTRWGSGFTYASGFPTSPSTTNVASGSAGDQLIIRANVTVPVGVAGWWDHEDTANDYFLAANEIDLFLITIPGSCTLNSITLALSGTVTVGGKMKAVIYPDSGGSPAAQALSGTGSEVTVASANTELVSTFALGLSAGDYWIGCIEDNGSHLKGWGSSNIKWKGGSYTYPTPPNPAPSPFNTTTIQPKIYAQFS